MSSAAFGGPDAGWMRAEAAGRVSRWSPRRNPRYVVPALVRMHACFARCDLIETFSETVKFRVFYVFLRLLPLFQASAQNGTALERRHPLLHSDAASGSSLLQAGADEGVVPAGRGHDGPYSTTSSAAPADDEDGMQWLASSATPAFPTSAMRWSVTISEGIAEGTGQNTP